MLFSFNFSNNFLNDNNVLSSMCMVLGLQRCGLHRPVLGVLCFILSGGDRYMNNCHRSVGKMAHVICHVLWGKKGKSISNSPSGVRERLHELEQ